MLDEDAEPLGKRRNSFQATPVGTGEDVLNRFPLHPLAERLRLEPPAPGQRPIFVLALPACGVAGLGVATWFLIRSMNRQLHKIDFSEDAIDRERRATRVPEVELATQVEDAQAKDPARPEADGSEGPGPAGDRLPE